MARQAKMAKISVQNLSSKVVLSNVPTWGYPKGEYWESPHFYAAGGMWSVDFYPEGDNAAVEGEASLFLRNETKHPITAQAKLIVKDKKGNKIEENTLDWDEYGHRMGWGFGDFMTCEQLERHESITLELTIKAENPALLAPEQEDEQARIDRMESNLKCIKNHLKSIKSTPTDVVLIGKNNCEVAAHKTFLSAVSPVFSAMFHPTHGFLECQEGRVEVLEFAESVLKNFVEFSYALTLDSIEEMEWDQSKKVVESLAVLADKYQCNQLALWIVEKLTRNLTLETIQDRIEIAKKVDARYRRDLIKVITQWTLRNNSFKDSSEVMTEVLMSENPDSL